MGERSAHKASSERISMNRTISWLRLGSTLPGMHDELNGIMIGPGIYSMSMWDSEAHGIVKK